MALFILKMIIYLAWETKIALMLAEKVTIPTKYFDYANIFLKELAKVLLEQISINDHSIKLKNGKRPPYESIYSLGLVELGTLKIYININLANGFIQPSKSSICTSIVFVCKPNGSLHLYTNYRGLNNLTIKNQYLLSLIGKSSN